MKESQYVGQYLACNGRWTLGTFLAYTLKGTAKEYSGKYKTALERALLRRVAAGEVEECQSVHKGIAYRVKGGQA